MGLILVALFVFAYYRLYGLISLASLVASGALVYGTLVLLVAGILGGAVKG